MTPAQAVQFSAAQCQVMREVGVDTAPLCGHVTSLRAESASYTTSAATGGQASSPAASSPSGGMAGQSGSPGAPGASPGGGGVGGTPGAPGGGGGSGRPGPPVTVEPPPQKPKIDPAVLAKIKGELQDAVRQAAIERIIHGSKPPPNTPGKPPSFGKPPHEGAMPDKPEPRSSPQGSQR